MRFIICQRGHSATTIGHNAQRELSFLPASQHCNVVQKFNSFSECYLTLKTMRGARDMAQQVRELTMQAQEPRSDSEHHIKGVRHFPSVRVEVWRNRQEALWACCPLA